MNNNINSPGQLIWRSRRGMRELDLLLVPFAKKGYGQLSAERQLLYQTMLSYEDQDLWAWFSGRIDCPDPKLQELIKLIKSFDVSKIDEH